MATKFDTRDLNKIRSDKRLAQMKDEAKMLQNQIADLQCQLEEYKNLIVQEQLWQLALENEVKND